MRIIAGEHRGRSLKAPKGVGTRPTTDRVRESLMSALSSKRGGFEGSTVLDAFAGSGALALEVMSRGGSFACLCERDGAALKVIEDNVRSMRYERDEVRVQKIDVLKSLAPRARAPYDLVFLDPPYALDASEVFALLARLDEAGRLDGQVIISYEHDSASDEQVDRLIEESALFLASRRRYGDTVIDIITRA